MSPACTELYERVEQLDEHLRQLRDAFTRRVVELECARKYGEAYRINTALGTLKNTAQIYIQLMTEHAEHVATYVAQEIRDPIVL
jgi:lactate dehydrogenase-like 2-hydroxyacid dehydrogenase